MYIVHFSVSSVGVVMGHELFPGTLFAYQTVVLFNKNLLTVTG